jgi:nicotinate-nucleotide pyrophosphorylase
MKTKISKKEIEGRNMETAGKLAGLCMVLCEHRGAVPNWEYAVETLRDIALGIAKCKVEVKVPRDEKRT